MRLKMLYLAIVTVGCGKLIAPTNQQGASGLSEISLPTSLATDQSFYTWLGGKDADCPKFKKPGGCAAAGELVKHWLLTIKPAANQPADCSTIELASDKATADDLAKLSLRTNCHYIVGIAYSKDVASPNLEGKNENLKLGNDAAGKTTSVQLAMQTTAAGKEAGLPETKFEAQSGDSNVKFQPNFNGGGVPAPEWDLVVDRLSTKNAMTIAKVFYEYSRANKHTEAVKYLASIKPTTPFEGYVSSSRVNENYLSIEVLIPTKQNLTILEQAFAANAFPLPHFIRGTPGITFSVLFDSVPLAQQEKIHNQISALKKPTLVRFPIKSMGSTHGNFTNQSWVSMHANINGLVFVP